jgi:mycothiol synthase
VSLDIREPKADEAAAIADLLNRHAEAAFGETEIAEPEVRRWFAMPEIWIRVAERDGRLVGYVDALRRGEAQAMELDIRTVNEEAAAALLAGAERHARTGVVRAIVQGDDEVFRSVVEADGWRPVRQSYQMRIELSDELPEPEWPAAVAVRTMQAGEAEERIYEANNEAFNNHWDFRPQPFAQWRSDAFGRDEFDPTLVWLAEEGDELAGFSANSWHFSGDPEFGWIGILGVRPLWRRRGLATALLHQSFQDFRRRGAKRVGLGVDAQNTTGAVRLYERVGMHVARRNDTYEKELR